MLPFRRRSRGNSLSTVPPTTESTEYDSSYAQIAASILYKSPLPSQDDLPVYILNSAAFPDSHEIDYNTLLSYVLTQLPSDDQLIGGKGYEVVFFAGGEERSSSESKKGRPGWGWFLQAYQVLSRAMRKRLQKLYLVHERRWIRMISEMFSTIVSPKFRRKVIHVSSLSGLALYIPVEDLLIPPAVYDRDRKLSPDIYVPYASGKRAFGAINSLPMSVDGKPRLPRVLRETSTFVLQEDNIKEEGIFRVNSRALTLDILKEAYDRGQKFIVWKEEDRAMTFGHWKEGIGKISLSPTVQMDGYSVFTAAGLIKLWYSSLREPLFPQSSYAFIDRVYGGTPAKPIEAPVLLDLIGQSADWSPLTKVARQILTMHLFPLLARISEKSAQNKMNARNLATCFAPSMLCGPDPFEDVKMSGIISKILVYGIEHWYTDLAEPCGMDGDKFEISLEVPQAVTDREDPLESEVAPPPDRGEQTEGIILLDNDETESEDEGDKPPLPPRAQGEAAITQGLAEANETEREDEEEGGKPSLLPRAQGEAAMSQALAEINAVKRKPAPPLQQPPRYSTIMTLPVDANQELPGYITQVGAGEVSAVGISEEASLRARQARPLSIARKPVPHSETD